MKRVTIGYKSFLCKVAKYVIRSTSISRQVSNCTLICMLSCVTVVRMLTIETRDKVKLAVYCLQVTSPGSSHRTGGGCGVGRGRTVHSQYYIFSKFICIQYPDLMHTSLIACRSQKLKKSADTAFFQRSLKTSGQKLVDQS